MTESKSSKRRRWTDEAIRALKLPPEKPEQRILVDAGLYVFLRRRTDDVAKQWQYRAQVAGVRRWLSLGSYPAVGLAKAKAELLEHQRAHEAAKKGEGDHPVMVARFARKVALAQPTVDEVFAEWIADKRLGSPRKGGRPVRERTVQVLKESYEADVEGRIGEAKASKLTRDALQACIDAPRKRGAPGAAAHVYRMLRGLVKFAIARGYIEGADPMRGIDNPRPYRPGPVNAASDAELTALLRAVDGSAMWESTKLAIEFQLLTGARPSEVRMAVWEEVNLPKAIWLIPSERVKSDRPFKVHLSAEARSLLERAKALPGGSLKATKGKDFVFPGANGAALEKMAIARALSRLAARPDSIKKLRPHDLRRTFRTMLSRLGVPPHVAELCMNHQETETMRRVYDGHDYFAEMVAAWDKAGAHVAALRKGGP